ncbi:MAG TPA: hybrid sensor histidine kinase/response regulator [Dissulfurispiraceae bacterium]|nr:hybrid sensor histidine kinase/response regulator [Dissulfurispiraceae bacterium]
MTGTDVTRVLIVEDNPADARLIKEMLLEMGSVRSSVTHVETLSKAIHNLETTSYDIVLLDLTLPDSEWPHTMLSVVKCAPEVAVVILTGLDNELRAIQSLKKGAQDYLVKGDINSRLLYRTMQHAIERQGLKLKMMLFEEEVKHKQRKIEELNLTLEQRVSEEVANNREKDYMLLQQGRLAAMGEMIGNIAHQWRQPLNNLGLLIQDLSHAEHHGELNREYLDRSVEEAMKTINFMSRTIEDFRNFFMQDKEKTLFSLKEVLETTLSFVGESFRNNNIKIEVYIQDDADIEGYPNEYSHVLLNILTNAKDIFLERGIEDPSVIIKLFCENGRSVITVMDNAGGISDDILDKIFDPYFTTKDQGMGIGLYMSKVIIEKNMGGKLTVRNTGNGAEFRVEV